MLIANFINMFESMQNARCQITIKEKTVKNADKPIKNTAQAGNKGNRMAWYKRQVQGGPANTKYHMIQTADTLWPNRTAADAVERTKKGFTISTQDALSFWVVREFLA